jgi:predicted metal-dependent HD superfamily phosphohydrolase
MSNERFAADAQAVGAHRPTDALYEKLRAAYAESQRAYHTMAHIEHGLELLDSVRGSLARPSEVALAYWFHDAVYTRNPLTSNEAESARWALDACTQLGVPRESCERIRTMILATKAHELPAGTEWRQDIDLETLLDIDLSILAADRHTFARFERDVRKEYDWVPLESAFVHGRKKVIDGFLGRPYIFHRPVLSARFEEAARRNLIQLRTDLADEGEPLDGISRVDATESHIFSTFRGRLLREHPWSEVHAVYVAPLPCSPRVQLMVRFGSATEAEAPFLIPLDEPASANAAQYIRSIPGYDLGAETRHRETRGPEVAFSSEKSGNITGPIRLGAATQAPYR